MTKLTRDKRLYMTMMEKYFHCRGAALCEEGRFDEAEVMLQDAISIEDQPYTRYQLSQAYLGKGDIDKALEEISRAIAFNNLIPEYYYERKKLWLLKGDGEKARIDDEKMLRLDRNYERIREILHAAKVFRQTFLSATRERTIDRTKIRQIRLREAIADYPKLHHLIGSNIEASTCILPCPAYCCYFSGETIFHGLSIGPWKLLAIRSYLKDHGLPEEKFFRKMALPEDERIVQLVPPHHVVRKGSNAFVYFPERQKGHLNSSLVCSLPKDTNYKSLVWINKKARPCAFLKDRRCMIHDLGDEPALPSCKDFLCMTGLVCIVLDRLGVVSKSRVTSMAFNDLTKIAVEALLIIVRELIEHSELTKQRKTMKILIRKAIKGNEEGNKKLIRVVLERYSRAKDQYKDLFASQMEKIRKEVDTKLRSISDE